MAVDRDVTPLYAALTNLSYVREVLADLVHEIDDIVEWVEEGRDLAAASGDKRAPKPVVVEAAE